MFSPTSLLLLVLLGQSGICSQTPFQAADQESAQICCQTFQKELPSIVHLSSSPEYKSRLDTYYALQQTDLHPSCQLLPTSPSEVSRILKIARDHDCPFAVRSGGYMSWSGSSNIDGGFVIDLRKLNQIDLSLHDGTVKLGPGSTWGEVYAAMNPYNLTTLGGRVKNVGVGGFLLGGGITFRSYTEGFSADHILNYEVVLSDGTIVNANKDSHPDLYWALRAGSTNYGIVTRLDLPTFVSSTVSASQDVYFIEKTHTNDILENYISYVKEQGSDVKHIAAVVLGQANGLDLAVTLRVYLGPNPSESYKPFTSATPIQQTETTGTLIDITNEIFSDKLYPPTRVNWNTLTIKLDKKFFWDFYTRGTEIFSDLKDREGLQWNILFQPMTKGLIESSSESLFYEALKSSNDDLVLVLIITAWKNAADDQVMEEAAAKLSAWGEAEASKRGLLNDFLYLNYASKAQPVYERSITKGDLATMRKVKQKYDPTGTFDKLWRGGFKLPQEKTHADREHDSSEL
ncbi:hypothetical protein V5O48_015734 [Marasmius crinis-equi]|uniref:FAD-binding PCMH-type domain-containing protein n=1 Tax=Marasmius crinis-equi TaxID=585013 RepID=A0ABR3ETR3_9AGAR